MPKWKRIEDGLPDNGDISWWVSDSEKVWIAKTPPGWWGLHSIGYSAHSTITHYWTEPITKPEPPDES